MARRKEPAIPDALLDQLLAGADAKAAFDPGGLLDGLKKGWRRANRRGTTKRRLWTAYAFSNDSSAFQP